MRKATNVSFFSSLTKFFTQTKYQTLLLTILLLDESNQTISHSDNKDLSSIITNSSIVQDHRIFPVDLLTQLHRDQEETHIEHGVGDNTRRTHFRLLKR